MGLEIVGNLLKKCFSSLDFDIAIYEEAIFDDSGELRCVGLGLWFFYRSQAQGS